MTREWSGNLSKKPLEIRHPELVSKMKQVIHALFLKVIHSEVFEGIARHDVENHSILDNSIRRTKSEAKQYISERSGNAHRSESNQRLKQPIKRVRQIVRRNGYPLEILAFVEAIRGVATTNNFTEIRKRAVGELEIDFFDAAFERLQNQQQGGPGSAR